MAPVSKEVLSLEEMLAEGAGTTVNHKETQVSHAANATAQFSKAQIKALQEAMYHSAENNHLGKIKTSLKFQMFTLHQYCNDFVYTVNNHLTHIRFYVKIFLW